MNESHDDHKPHVVTDARMPQKGMKGLLASRRTGALFFACIFAVAGSIFLFRSFAASTSVSLFSATTIPSTIDSDDGQAVEVGVKFKSDVAGTITGVSFYKSALNTGVHVGNLWSSSGALLASATFTNESDSGWQRVTFANPVAIQANTVYVASYHTNAGHYSDNTQGTAKAIDVPPLHALADGASGPNGVYAYGAASSFPTNGWEASNYWVDVDFTPNATGSGDSTSVGGSTASSGNLSVDQQVATHQGTPNTAISSPAFSTTGSNELLVAFLTSDGPQTGAQSFSSVTGGGLTWKLRQRVNAQPGATEIWQAVASAPLSNVRIKATRANGSYVGSLVITAFKGASTTADGAVAGGNGSSGMPTLNLTTTHNGSWVWATGNDWDKATARTVGNGQTKVNEYLASVGDTYWVQRQNTVTANSGTAVTMNDTTPTSDHWNLAGIEIMPAATNTPGVNPPPTTGDTMPPSTPTNLTASATSSSQVNLSWAASTDNVGVSGYNIYRNGAKVGTTSATTLTDSGLTANTTYSYTVSAFDAAGNVSSASNVASATTKAATD